MPPTPTTIAAMTSMLWTVPVTKSQHNTAYRRATSPNRPATRPPFFRLIGSAPPVGLDRAVGREQAEGDDREEVDDVLQLQGTPAERIEMADGGEVGDEVSHPALGLGSRPADDPG